MKVLILSCNTGGGHNAAGRALYEEFHRRGIECEFLDTLSFARPKASKKASSIYVPLWERKVWLLWTILSVTMIGRNSKKRREFSRRREKS